MPLSSDSVTKDFQSVQIHLDVALRAGGLRAPHSLGPAGKPDCSAPFASLTQLNNE
jgi:hypothetical protein